MPRVCKVPRMASDQMTAIRPPSHVLAVSSAQVSRMPTGSAMPNTSLSTVATATNCMPVMAA